MQFLLKTTQGGLQSTYRPQGIKRSLWLPRTFISCVAAGCEFKTAKAGAKVRLFSSRCQLPVQRALNALNSTLHMFEFLRENPHPYTITFLFILQSLFFKDNFKKHFNYYPEEDFRFSSPLLELPVY